MKFSTLPLVLLVSLAMLSSGAARSSHVPLPFLSSQITSTSLTTSGWQKVGRQDIKGGIADFTAAMRLNPKDGYAYFSRGMVYSKIGNYQQAIADFTKGLEVSPGDPGMYYGRAVAREKAGDSKGALTDYRQVVSKPADTSLGFRIRGLSRLKVGDPKSAIQDFEKARQMYLQRGDQAGAQQMTDLINTTRQRSKP